MGRCVRSVGCLFVLAAVIAAAGCGSEDGPRVVYGKITVGGETPDSGEIRFVPIDGTSGSVNAAVILDGEYRIEGRGGLPVGKYRVEVLAKKKTGQQTQENNGFEMVTVDEQLPIGPPAYAGAESPLTHEVTADGDDLLDLDLPVE
jgi:hypothetical protein